MKIFSAFSKKEEKYALEDQMNLVYDRFSKKSDKKYGAMGNYLFLVKWDTCTYN